MTATVHKLETKTHRVVYDGPRREDEVRANAADAAPRWPAKPEPLFGVSALTGDHRLSRFAPTLTHRVHYGAPKARGHRQWLKLEGRG